MSKEITQAKKLMVARLYVEGLSYDEIARKTGIAKGSVAAVVEDLKKLLEQAQTCVSNISRIIDMNISEIVTGQPRGASLLPAAISFNEGVR